MAILPTPVAGNENGNRNLYLRYLCPSSRPRPEMIQARERAREVVEMIRPAALEELGKGTPWGRLESTMYRRFGKVVYEYAWYDSILAEHRDRGAQARFLTDKVAHGWTADTLLFRHTDVGFIPSRGCLFLHLEPTGMPRLYTVAQVEAADAQGPNVGLSKTWHVCIGSNHQTCRCGLWTQWGTHWIPIYERKAEALRNLYARKRVGRWRALS